MNILNLCGPVVLYLGFSLIQIIIDIFREHFNVALLKFIVMIVFATVLNILCSQNLTIVAWLIVFIPFIFMTVITTLLLIAFGIDPQNKSLVNIEKKNSEDIDMLTCDLISNKYQCLINNCEWEQMTNNPSIGYCKFSKKIGRHIGKDIGQEIAEGIIKNIGGDPATWGPPSSPSSNKNIGGDPATWGPPSSPPSSKNIGGDPETWGPTNTPSSSKNIGGDPATWEPITTPSSS